VVLAALTAAGCGRTGKVSGTVTFQGKPLPGGKIIFYSEEGRPSGTGFIEDGRYEVADAPVGPCKIVVSTSILLTMGAPPAAMAQQPPPADRGGMPLMPPVGVGGAPPMPPGADGHPMSRRDREEFEKHRREGDPKGMNEVQAKAKERYVEIPDIFETEKTTTLRTEVRGGPQTFDITLTPPPGWKPNSEYLKRR
jgi:hypothetical protein